MITPRVARVVLGTSVILAGVGGAWLFRKPPAGPAESPLADEEPRSLRPTPPRVPAADNVPRLLGPIDAVDSPVDAPVETRRSTGEPAETHGKTGSTAANGAARPRTMKYTIRDGDTLVSLAARYLGDGGRFREIFDANRERLANADVLPIGAEIEIPLGAAPATRDADDERALVPVP